MAARRWWTRSVARQDKGRQESAVGNVQRQLGEWWCRAVELKNRGDDRAVHIFREHNKEADACARGPKVRTEHRTARRASGSGLPRPEAGPDLLASSSGFESSARCKKKRFNFSIAFSRNDRFTGSHVYHGLVWGGGGRNGRTADDPQALGLERFWRHNSHLFHHLRPPNQKKDFAYKQ